MSVGQFEIQSIRLNFLNQDSVTASFAFTNIPFVTATSDRSDDVNIYVESVTNTGCVVRSSAPITGPVYLNIIGKV